MKTLRVITFILCLTLLPMGAWAIESLSEDQLDAVTAREGVTIFLEGKISVTQEFTNMGVGDDDGIRGMTGAGWLILDTGGETSAMEVSLNDAKIEIDVASTAADGYDIIGDSRPDIPAYTSFVRFGLPDNIAVNTYLASGYHIYVNSEFSKNGASYLGEIRMSDLQIQFNSTPTALYIYGH